MSIALPTLSEETLASPLLSSTISPASTAHQRRASLSTASPAENHSSQQQQQQQQQTTGLASIPIRLFNHGLSILLRIRATLPATLRPWFWIGLWFVFGAVGLAVFAGFHTKIFEILEAMAAFIKGLGRAGPPIIMLGLFLTAFPPLVGYSSLVTMSGYVYGFGFGLFIAYTSALLGSIACFYLCRRWFKVQVRAMMAKKQSLKSVVKAVEKRGFKLMILIRLAPYPFNVMNALLSATHIPLSTFTLATALSLTKLALHVYIGSTLSSLAGPPTIPPPTDDGSTGEGGTDGQLPITDTHGRNLKIFVMIISMILGIAVGAYVWMVAKREIDASEGIRIERRRKRRESLRLNRASMRRSSGGGNAAAGRGSAREAHHRLLARTGSAGTTELGQECVPVGDSTSGSDFVGGALSNNAYLDEDEGQEDQALVGNGRRSGPVMNGGLLSSSTLSSPGGYRPEYGTDSEVSDFLDEDYDDDDDVSDMERGHDDGESSLDPRQHQNRQQHQRSTSSSSMASWQSGTEMDVRGASVQGQGGRGTDHDSSMGWFAQNGVDMSDRNW
ncbi:hypothetical protein BGZ72_004510 [Mortierella alpina]|nr:hypothetical protein BGZ72_004510 [Mortierella alpina]